MPGIARRLLLQLLPLTLFFCAPAAAAGLERFTLGPARLEERQGMLRLSLPLSVDNEQALEHLLREGVMLELRLRVELERRRLLWFNEDIAALDFSSLLRHDPLNREFTLLLPDLAQPLRGRELRGLLAASWKKLDLPLLQSARLSEGELYLAAVELRLLRAGAPPWLERTLMFWDKDVVEAEQLSLEYHKEQDASLPR